MPGPLSRRELGILLALIVAGAALRFATLGVQSFELDEAATVLLVKNHLGAMLSQIPRTENTPPLYYLLAWGWGHVYGTGEVGLRSLSALLGTAMIPVAFLAARELVSTRVGLLAAGLTAFNPLLVWHSQQARSYQLAALAAALSFWLFARALRNPSGRALAGWAVASALALASHYFAVFVVVPEAAILLWRTPARRRTVWAVAGVAMAGLALLPLAIHQRQTTGKATIIEDSGSLGRRVLALPKQYLVGFDAPAERALAILAGLLVLAALVLLWRRADPRERGGAWPAAAVGVAAVTAALVLALAGTDYFNTRNLIVAWLPAAVVAGAGLGSRRAGPAGLAIAAGLCALFAVVVIAVASDRRLQRDDWRDAAHALGPARVAREVIASPPTPEPLQVYLPGVRPSRGHPPVRELDLVAIAPHRAGHERAAPAAVPPPALAGRRPFAVRRGETYAVVRYRFPRPVPAAAGVVPGLDRAPAIVLVQGPG